MDRKGIIGIIFAVLGLASYQIYVANVTQKANKLAAEQALLNPPAAIVEPAPAAATPAAVPAGTAPAAAAPVTPGAPAPATAPSVPEERVTLSSSTTEYTFTNLGGGIARARLLNHNAEGDAKVVINEFGTLPVGAISELPGEGIALPYTATPNAAGGEINFERKDTRGLQTLKKFILPKNAGPDAGAQPGQEYVVRMDVAFVNQGAQPLQLPSYFVYSGSSAPIHQRDLPTYTGFNFYRESGSHFVDVNWFNGGNFMSSRQASAVYTEASPMIRWAAVTNQYFTSILTPVVDDKASSDMLAKHRGSQVWARRFVIEDAAWQAAAHSIEGRTNAARYAIDGAVGMPGFSLAPGETFTQSFDIYLGPREYRRLKSLGNHQDEIMEFGMFGIVSKTLLNSMNTLRSFFGNYAWAIVVLTLLIKSLLWPLQNKATQSMKRMQALQPMMTELREKYKDDPTRMNTELMKLYRDYKINPLAGCLPMLIQIPIFFGFYNMLGKAVELRHSSFLWVKDLSQPDTVAHLMGYPINILPLCMAVTMLTQMAIQPKSGDPTQQKVMMFMPLIFIFFCYNFASALALYWTVQNVFSIVQLYLTRNQAPPVLTKVASTPASKKKSRS